MTAALLAPHRREGLRPVNPTRDMAAVAELIELAFASELDPASRRMVREMRRVGRAGWLGGIFGRMFLPPAASAEGFVYEEGGRLVGNASLLPVGDGRRRWVLANVAVAPSHRRRGIARSLVRACLDYVRQRGGREVVLQVQSANSGAQVLYGELGFRPVGTRTSWRRPRGLPLPAVKDDAPVRRRRLEEWREQYALAARLHPEGLIWPYPPRVSLFRPGTLARLLGIESGWHWVWREDGALLASMSAYRNLESSGWRIVLCVEPEMRGRVEAMLLAKALAELPGSPDAMHLDYPTGPADEALAALGFQPERTLTWMIHELY